MFVDSHEALASDTVRRVLLQPLQHRCVASSRTEPTGAMPGASYSILFLHGIKAVSRVCCLVQGEMDHRAEWRTV
jgi:hypothetical protein